MTSPYLDLPTRPEAEVRAARRACRVGARDATVTWSWPGYDSKLVIEVAHDEFGSRYINDVTDAAGQQFPWEQVHYEGRSLVEILEEHVRWQPELREAE